STETRNAPGFAQRDYPARDFRAAAQPPDGRPNERFLIARVSRDTGDHASVRVSGKAFFFRRFTGGGGGVAPGRTPTAGTLVGNRQRDPGAAGPISPGI